MSRRELVVCGGGPSCRPGQGVRHLAVRDGVPVGIGQPGGCATLLARAATRDRLAAALGVVPPAAPAVTVAILPGEAEAVARSRDALRGLESPPAAILVATAHEAVAACATPLLLLLEPGGRPRGAWLQFLTAPFSNAAVAVTTAPPSSAGELSAAVAAVQEAHLRGSRVDALEGRAADVRELIRAAARCYRVDDVRGHGGIPAGGDGERRIVTGLIASGGRVVPVPAAAVPGAPEPRPRTRGRRRPARREGRPAQSTSISAPGSAGTAPEISVVIPTTPARHDALLECAAAIASQTLPRESFEVIVVVNGRGEVPLRPVPGADVVEGLPVPSAAAARNHGARIARAAWVVFVDDDVLLAPGALAAHLDALRGGAGVTLGPYYPEDDASVTGAFARLWWSDHLFRKARREHVMSFIDFITGNTGISRETYLTAGGLDETFPGAHREDWELGFRLLRDGVRFTAVPDAAGIHRHRLTAAKYLRDRRAQGYGDVVLVERHPETAGAVTMGRLNGRTSGPRWRAVVGLGGLVGRPRTVAIVEAILPRLGVRRGLAMLRLAAAAAYCAGVDAALHDGRHPVGAPGGMMLDVTEDPPRAVPVASPVCIVDAGVPLGRVDLPGGQWDADVVAAAAAGMLPAAPRAIAYASGGDE